MYRCRLDDHHEAIVHTSTAIVLCNIAGVPEKLLNVQTDAGAYVLQD